jgi:putative NADPH-quinone reductase
MNILIVTAHPSSYGYTHTIANTYAEVKRAKKHTVEIVNLYSKEYKVDLLSYENMKEFKQSAVQKKFQSQLLAAHEIVVVHPVWWGTPPSIMKSWVELAFWKRVAYQYSKDGKLEKLLEGRSAKVFVTCGGPAWIYKLPFLPLKSFWGLSVFEYCGIDLTEVKICGNLNILEGEQREKHFQKFLKTIKNSAKK